MNIRIFTDSASDLLFPKRSEITILPMTITFGETEYLDDGINLTHQKFYELLVEGEDLPVTSLINPEQFEIAFKSAVDAGETVVAVLLSGKLSGTYQSARIAAEMFPGKVYVVDSENASIGEQILVERAVELMDAGLDAASIACQLDREKKSIRLIALLDTLEYLKRGGRISSTTAMVGGLLSIKPVLTVKDGEVVMLGKARGSKNGNNFLVQEIQKTTGIDFSRPYRLGYTGFDDTLLKKYIIDSQHLWQNRTDNLPVSTIGGTIGTHVGPGAIAVAFFSKERTCR